MRFLEAAVFNLESAYAAEAGGADRLEVCEDYITGGLTPSSDFVSSLRKTSELDIFVMIRERSDNFTYSRKEMDKMLKDIELFKTMRVNGFVFGSLDKDRNVNVAYSKEITEAASPLPVTFHRAFDLCYDLDKAAEEIIECGFRRILTSGGKNSAYEGRFKIRELISKYGKNIIFIPGGGIRGNNVSEIESITKATEFHTSGLRNTISVVKTEIMVNDIIKIKNCK